MSMQIISPAMRNASLGNGDVNQSSSNASSLDSCFQPRLSRTILAVALVDILLSVATVAGNLLVVFAVIRNRQLRNVTSVFILGLAASDLLVGLNVPYYVAFYFNFRSLSCHRTSCLLRYWFTMYASGCSMLCLVGVAVDRYIAILHPLSYHRVVRTRYASLYVLLVWISMGIVSSLPLVGVGERFDPSNECDLYYAHTKRVRPGSGGVGGPPHLCCDHHPVFHHFQGRPEAEEGRGGPRLEPQDQAGN
ncbi:hypothetical protein CEXT_226261 [Caerostris extrusa]|uniref:G-protein coupled receptors family 1 profile domain-containing protein n=1 Tax=Caerostris extrusa TaxID=172846 RepID=A0AAV4NZK6_CAEEX|nr:hypothetical protein CEXT_226261 [Caerostris extrusa]